jgi:hypothetical protein
VVVSHAHEYQRQGVQQQRLEERLCVVKSMI